MGLRTPEEQGCEAFVSSHCKVLKIGAFNYLFARPGEGYERMMILKRIAAAKKEACFSVTGVASMVLSAQESKDGAKENEAELDQDIQVVGLLY